MNLIRHCNMQKTDRLSKEVDFEMEKAHFHNNLSHYFFKKESFNFKTRSHCAFCQTLPTLSNHVAKSQGCQTKKKKNQY